jgi:hypothetical protein
MVVDVWGGELVHKCFVAEDKQLVMEGLENIDIPAVTTSMLLLLPF